MAKSDLRQFDYKKVARLDTAMWRAYYNHQFIKLFFLLLQVMRSQLRLNWYLTVKMAYYAGWAAADYRLRKGREDYKKTLSNLTKYEKILSEHSIQPFDYEKVARLELEWWDIHRYPKKYKKSLMISESELRLYAEGREFKKAQILELENPVLYPQEIKVSVPITMQGAYITNKNKKIIFGKKFD